MPLPKYYQIASDHHPPQQQPARVSHPRVYDGDRNELLHAWLVVAWDEGVDVAMGLVDS